MGRKRKTAMEKFKDWAKLHDLDENSEVEPLSINEIDILIFILLEMRYRHPDVNLENTRRLSRMFQVNVWSRMQKPLMEKVLYPRKKKVDLFRQVIGNDYKFYINDLEYYNDGYDDNL